MNTIKKFILGLLDRAPRSFQEIQEAVKKEGLTASENYLHHLLYELQEYGVIKKKIVYFPAGREIDYKDNPSKKKK